MASNGGLLAGGGDSHNDGADEEVLSRICQALDIVHSPYSTNESRRQAQEFLEKIKGTPQAPMHGRSLASDKSQPSVARHYGLSLLEHAIRYQWAVYDESQAKALLSWVLELSQAVSKDDPSYLRNKTAQLWVELAKRCWGAEWMNMDELLVRLWEVPDSAPHKEFVLFVLEAMSDEIFTGDDAVVAEREGVLSKACVEIFTPTAVLYEAFPNRQPGPDVRHGSEGWLSRLSQFLDLCLSSGVNDNQDVKICTLKSLSSLLSLMPWAIPMAIASAQCVRVLCSCLGTQDADIQKLALEALYALYSRTNFTSAEFRDLVLPMYDAGAVKVLQNLFEWSAVDVNDLDDDKYQVQKKLSEVLSCLGEHVERKWNTVFEHGSAEEFLNLLVQVTQSSSLMVSIPTLVAWTRLLTSKHVGSGDRFANMIGPLLEICSSRLVRYENLPDDSDDPSFLFLQEDTETAPERHAFLGNYRRFSSQLIEAIVQLKAIDAVSHILGSTEYVLQNLYEGGETLNKENYSRHSLPALRVDSRFTVVEAALKGYMKWKWVHRAEQIEQSFAELDAQLESWCNKLLAMNFEDPIIRKRTLQLLVYFSTTALKKNTGFMLMVLEHILMTWPTQEPEHRALNDAIKDLQSESMHELQRLAYDMPDHLLDVYDQIETRVNEMLASGTLDEKRAIAYQGFLFIILHRTTKIGTDAKVQRLRSFVDPVKEQWQAPSIRESLATYSSFCKLLALDKAQAYLVSHRAGEIRDWGSCPLDAEGTALQTELEERLKLLPLRATKSFLAFSVERLAVSDEALKASYALWQEGFADILGGVLKYLSYGHASHDPDYWTGLPSNMREMVDKVLTDRFWQSGISDGSKDDFYARVVGKRNTIEGLASTIRATVRTVRETAYAAMYCMSRLRLQFYEFADLSEPLAEALFAESTWLSTHQQHNLLNLTRFLVDDCPVDRRQHFLPRLLATCFQQMDSKISAEWNRKEQRQQMAADNEAALKEEMKSESILRQVTYTAVLNIADFLDPTTKPSTFLINGEDAGKYPTLRRFCLMRREIVEPLLVFCCNGIRFKDTRSCSVILRLFVSLVPEFSAQGQASKKPPQDVQQEQNAADALDLNPIPDEIASAIREYISTEVLKACVGSFHDPYYVELQKDLAQLIATIVVYYSGQTSTPRDVLLSVPNINPADLERLQVFLAKPGSHTRQQRQIVLDMFKDFKGVSVSEMGKLPKSIGFGASSKKSGRSKMAQAFMKEQPGGGTRASGTNGNRDATPDALESVSNLFET